jgi:hypothetical protein
MNKFILKRSGPEEEVKKVQVNLQEEQEKEASALYSGSVENNRPHGPGHLEFFDGSEYIGDFFAGAFNGNGIFTQNDGSRFQGIFEDGERKSGTMYYTNGEIYNGDWSKVKRNGLGKLTYTNGDIWDGFWIDDKREGKGKLIRKDGDVFEGFWINDRYHALGSFDPLFAEAGEYIISMQQVTISFLQVKFCTSYWRTSRLINQLEKAGVVGSFAGARSRVVLIKDLCDFQALLKKLKID